VPRLLGIMASAKVRAARFGDHYPVECWVCIGKAQGEFPSIYKL